MTSPIICQILEFLKQQPVTEIYCNDITIIDVYSIDKLSLIKLW
jgi:hypothetical protein